MNAEPQVSAEERGTMYRVRLWCRDCTGIDYRGCFDGGTELLSDRIAPFAVREFVTVEAATEAGYDATAKCGPWEFDVETDDGEVVYRSRELS